MSELQDRMRRRLAVSEQDKAFDDRHEVGITATFERLDEARDLATTLMQDEPARPQDHPEFIEVRHFGGDVMQADRAGMVAELWQLLENIDRAIPAVEAWCVVKIYTDPTWTPAVWTAHVDREQAYAFALAIADHYQAKRPYNSPHDEPEEGRKGYWGGGAYWQVAWAAARIRQFVGTDLSPEEYVRWLG